MESAQVDNKTEDSQVSDIITEFTAIGGNRNPAASDWDHTCGTRLLAFGAANTIALWDPEDKTHKGVTALLKGHSGDVTAVKFLPGAPEGRSCLITGSTDGSLIVWWISRQNISIAPQVESRKILRGRSSAITRIAVCPSPEALNQQIFISGSSDGQLGVWTVKHNEVEEESFVINLNPHQIPLAIALAHVAPEAAGGDGMYVIAVGGSKNKIQILTSSTGPAGFQQVAVLTGHENWIRSLDFTVEHADHSGTNPGHRTDLLLASASQDKYIRLWRLHRGRELPRASGALNNPALGIIGRSLSSKPHRFQEGGVHYSVTFEALLLGHEDPIFTATWRHRRTFGEKDEHELVLLSASEDNSLTIWEADPASGIWVSKTRLGEISAQKGSTTATGSTGGFWAGLWGPDAYSVVSLGGTGSWRMWNWKSEDGSPPYWEQQVAITGHIGEVKSVCWSPDGSYLLSTGSDQTTRLWAQWHNHDSLEDDADNRTSWHEFSRPQIHGYDLNCIDSVSNTQFISGADEKLLRVFDEPKGVATMLSNLCDIKGPTEDLPDAANIPVLGLSNKAIQAVEDDECPAAAANVDATDEDDREAIDPASIVKKSTLSMAHPPFEDHLARHLLWPETEKLYGHGFEISAVAASHDGSVVATACKASSLDHAVIRLYSTKTWLELNPPLAAHTLTVTSLAFSHDDAFLLSTGRDRQWAVFKRQEQEGGDVMYTAFVVNPKGHSRMILDGSWARTHREAGDENRVFGTAGRDKLIKIWWLGASAAESTLLATVAADAPVLSLAFLDHCSAEGPLVWAFGLESGRVGVCLEGVEGLVGGNGGREVGVRLVEEGICPVDAVNCVVWRPVVGRNGGTWELAVASDDGSVRVYKVLR